MALTLSANMLRIGTKAPDFSLLGVDGKMHALKGYPGKPTLIIFMCNHCPYVVQKMDMLVALHNRFGERVHFVGINSNDARQYPDDNYDNMKKFAARHKMRFSYLHDTSQEVAKAYGATCTPDPFLLDAEHRLIFHGRLNDQMQLGDRMKEETMSLVIEEVLAGNKPRIDFEPSMGCSIKWR